jgi:hypothetical protein
MKNKNMVDERFECISIIFRLTGNWEYNIGYSNIDVEYPFSDEQLQGYLDGTNDYQREVAENFKKFAEHEAVAYARELSTGHLKLGFDAPFRFAVHIEKKGSEFVFIDNIDSLFDGRWNDGRAEKFLFLFNKFYKDTYYAEFYTSHISYFEKITKKFIDEYYQYVDLEWFSKYVDISNLRCILSPSNSICNYAATINNKIVYCLVREKTAGAVIHEYCHSFGNPLAEKLYAENAEFKKWCDDSVDLEKMPYYNQGWAMANEYVTDAYTILYHVQHGENLEEQILKYKNRDFENSFPYAEEVYNMILALEK